MTGGPGWWSAAVVALLAATAVGLAVPPPAGATRTGWAARRHGGLPAAGDDGTGTTDERGWLVRHRSWWSLLAGCAAATFLGGVVGVVGGVVGAVVVWVVIGRSETPATRREREAVVRDLPHVVGLLGAAVQAGHAPGPALALVCDALPGPAADRLAVHPPRLALGLDPGEVWGRLATDAELAPLGRALARAHETGAPVGAAVTRLGVELAASARAEVEDRARRVGVRAAVPLGLCLLPSFVLLGIVPLVAGLVASLQLG